MLGSKLNDITNELERLRTIGATGKKLNAPSDDPAAIRPVLTTLKQISNVDRYLETMGQSTDKMQATDGYLNQVENIMQRVKEISINGVNAALNDEDASILADEVAQMRHQLFDAANGVVNGKYIFAGYLEQSKPFSLNPNPLHNPEDPSYDPTLYEPNDHNTWPVIYNGDENRTELEITPGERIQVNLTGNDLFLGTKSWNQPPYNPPDPAGNPPNGVDPGRFNLFAVLVNTENALRISTPTPPDPLPSGFDFDPRATALQTQLTAIDGASEQNRRLRSQLGNLASRVEEATRHQQRVTVDLQQILSRYVDADAIESFNNIIKQETAFKAALSITGKISRISILDFI
jgi:flagellar hook-associated protein 3 FlgL